MTRFPDSNSRAAGLVERARQVMPGGNTRHGILFPPYPLYAASGAGAYVTDVEGDRYLDMIGNFTSAIHGHCFPPVVEALTRQAAQLINVGLPTPLEIDLAELLCERVPSIEQLRFANSGSEAVILAIKAARAYTGRPMIAKFEGAYHGLHDGIEVSMYPMPETWGPNDAPATVAMSRGTPQGVLDAMLVLPLNDIAAVRTLLHRHRDELAGVIIDPMMSRIGMTRPEAAFVEEVRDIVTEIGALLLFDEIYSFRLGHSGVQGLDGVTPDITMLGKIIGGGIPIGAVGGRAEVMAVFDHRKGIPSTSHSGTFNANPLAMAAGMAAMTALDDACFAHLDRLGARFRTGLEQAIARTGTAAQVKGRGSIWSLIMDDAPIRAYRSFAAIYYGHAARIAGVHRAALQRGLLFIANGTFVLSSVMTDEDVDFAVATLEAALAAPAGPA